MGNGRAARDPNPELTYSKVGAVTHGLPGVGYSINIDGIMVLLPPDLVRCKPMTRRKADSIPQYDLEAFTLAGSVFNAILS